MGDTADGKRRSFALDARQQKLFDENLQLVTSAVGWALRAFPRSVDIDVVRGAALRGLMKAARDFDPERGVSFFTYASNPVRGRIYGEIRDELREMDFFGGFRRGTSAPLFMATGDVIDRIVHESHESTYGDGAVGSAKIRLNDGFRSLTDSNESQQVVDAREAVQHLVSKLSPADRQLIQWGYLDTPRKSWVEIARLLDLHYSRISQRMTEIRRKLRRLAIQAGM